MDIGQVFPGLQAVLDDVNGVVLSSIAFSLGSDPETDVTSYLDVLFILTDNGIDVTVLNDFINNNTNTVIIFISPSGSFDGCNGNNYIDAFGNLESLFESLDVSLLDSNNVNLFGLLGLLGR